jgi:hypothetical protein
MENEEQHREHEKQKWAILVIIQKYMHKWLAGHTYLKSLSPTIVIQCCWRQVLARREFWRLKQQAYGTTIIHIKDYKMNLLEERGNNTVQPWILCLGLIGRPFGQDCIFPWNLAYVPCGHDGCLAWDSLSQHWFVHDDGFSQISLIVHSTRLG